MVRVLLRIAMLTFCVLFTRAALSEDRWPQFRGPDGTGVEPSKTPGPVLFGPGKNELWKAPIPPGLSSPCVWHDRIFLTACLADEKKLETICLNRDDGRVLWRQAVTVNKLEEVHKTSSPANATTACDGERVYVYFGSYGVIAYDLDGSIAWELRLPIPNVMFGTGSSPIIVGDLVVLNRLENMGFGFGAAKKEKDASESAKSEILALDRKSGRVAWRRTMRMTPGGRSHATPAAITNGGQNQIIIAGGGRISALDAANGEPKWWADGLPVVATATPLIVIDRLFLNCTGLAGDVDPLPKVSFADALKQWDKNSDGKLQRDELPDEIALFTRHRDDGEGNFGIKMFFFRNTDKDRDGSLSTDEWEAMYNDVVKGWTERMKPATVAVRLGGEGDVTKSHTMWTMHKGVPEVPSLLLVGSNLYAVRNGGLATCYAADTGKILYEERLGASGSYYASPISDGTHVYFVSQPGVITVLRAGDKFEKLARVDLREESGATPALVGGKLYVRTNKHLLAFGPGK